MRIRGVVNNFLDELAQRQSLIIYVKWVLSAFPCIERDERIYSAQVLLYFRKPTRDP